MNLRAAFFLTWCDFDVSAKELEITELETASSNPDFWQDQQNAQKAMKKLAANKRTSELWRGLERRINDLTELAVLSREDPSLSNEIEHEISGLTAELDSLEVGLAFSGQYDNRNALLTVHAGAGGVESQDWAGMLLRMFMRWAEKKGFGMEILDQSLGEEAGIKSATLQIEGEYAYGFLKSEHGVHRLIRLSPFDADHARHTSFALVEIMPEAEDSVDIDIKPEDIKIDMFRSSGPGGQNVQKVSTAVRVTHIPSGIVVASQTERSQHQNREIAMRILASKLLAVEIAKRAEERAKLKGERISAEWGSQIRSYVLHPYKMVKDHRTDYEVGNAEAVLEGELDGFISAYLRQNIGRE
ncbi:peptide chain release factor 2 [Dehalococcoides mccartyi]|uniref:Peptide chain release factor 2 n=2 Tax=Dehalococcoides mccartyi TaxID=61435 RepID=A0A142V927_9CHLR|nr:peptide chain release factor 2 [Dehalococcoides mccartyi DCMB5]AGG07637.1 peptide chain release factor 2 [Dehalococcoides mccartyi BTF08]AMU86336.1 peptide chain release factor 2 [Dehalococcoides mccartyi]CAI82732.1 peptide chain release factor 2 [Dehalococcoides mccartyi CBDB1]AOV99169.1 peptide chain release factor 2 [Dehalococcoides mccartyi]